MFRKPSTLPLNFLPMSRVRSKNPVPFGARDPRNLSCCLERSFAEVRRYGDGPNFDQIVTEQRQSASNHKHSNRTSGQEDHPNGNFEGGRNPVNSKVSEAQRSTQRYICSNPRCRTEIEVQQAPGCGTPGSPQCVCGSPMRKPYQKPVLTIVRSSEARERLEKMRLD